MTIQSIALFAHLLGVLALFAGFTIEWLCVEQLRAPDAAGPVFTMRVLERLPPLTGIAVALVLLSGIAMAARIGVLRAAFVVVSFVGMAVMAVLGGIALRPLVRALKERRRTGADAVTELGQLASRPFLRASLRIRVWIALAIAYLMVAKPDLLQCAVVLAIALLVAVLGNMVSGRSPGTMLSPEDAAERRARTIGGS